MSKLVGIIDRQRDMTVEWLGIPVVRTDELSDAQLKRATDWMRPRGLRFPCLVPDEVIGTKEEQKFEVTVGLPGSGPVFVNADGTVSKPKHHPNEDDITFLAVDILEEVEKFFPDLERDTKREDQLLERITTVLAEKLDPDDRPDSAYN